ncbi:MAG: cation transporter [Nitrospirae bacterium]|nr:MAG: cation transporter [Nitrospirota bacterium]
MKQRAAALSVFSNTALVALKVLAWVFTGSVSILSEALHSGTDLMASLIAYFSVKKAEKPPDEAHPFGHGKLENLSGLIEGVLVLVAALLVIWHAVERLLSKALPEMAYLGFSVMLFGAVVNLLVSRYLFRVAQETDSMALKADALHLSVDVYTSAGVTVGLFVLAVTGWTWVDPVIAIAVSVIILYEGAKLTYDALQTLLDRALPEDERKLIEEVIQKHSDMIKDYHDLRTRKAGPYRYVDLHLTVCQNQDMATVHRTMDSIEESIKEALPNTDVVIHPEPCSHHNNNCPKECYWLRLRHQGGSRE